MNSTDIAGRWQILSWEQHYDDGRRTYPMGQQLEGFIQYDRDRMVCMISRADRQPFTTGGQWNASDDEKAQAYLSFMSYAGSYKILNDEVHHLVEQSLFPNWKGGTQIRKAQLQDDRLFLTARIEEGTSEARTVKLVWEREERH